LPLGFPRGACQTAENPGGADRSKGNAFIAGVFIDQGIE